MEFGLIAQWIQLGFGGVVSIVLIYLVTIYNPKRDKDHQEETTAIRTAFEETLDKICERYERQISSHQEQDVEAHSNIVQMCSEQLKSFAEHDKEMRSGMKQIIYAIMLLNPDISPTDRQKITDRLLNDRK